MDTLGKRLKFARERLRPKVSQKALGACVNLSQQMIAKLESDQSEETSAIVRIATELGVRPQWLETGEGPMTEARNIQVRYEKAPEGVRGAIDKLLRYEQESADVERAVKVIDALIPDPPSLAGH